MEVNYYQLLGISKNANQSEIKKAYRNKAIKYHPDKGGDEDIFKKIAEAYEVLSDPVKKQQYDGIGIADLDLLTDPISIFNEFERMFHKSFIDPGNLTTHPYSGFNNMPSFSNHSEIFLNGSTIYSFTQTTIEKNTLHKEYIT